MPRVGVLVSVIAALMMVVVALVTVLAPSRPILAKPTLFGIGVAHLVDLMAQGCGPVGTGATGEAGIGVAAFSIDA
jgi:hypothetical protein